MVRVFHKSLGNELVSATEQLQGSVLQISADEPRVRLQIDLSQAKIEKGGSNNQLFLLTTPRYPEWTIYIRDYELIKRVKAEAGLQVPRKNVFDSGFSMVVGVVIVVAGLLGGLYLAKDPMVNWLVWQVPKKYEAELGKAFINQLVGVDSGRFEGAREELSFLFQPLVSIAKTEGYDLKIYIKNDSSLNAFALPGGFLSFNTGLLLAAETPEEILGVGAHELAHVTRRHSLKQIIQTLGTYVFLQMAFGDFTGIAGVFIDNSSFLLARMYSREAEREADLVGLNYLYESQISGRGLLVFMERVKAEAEKMKAKQPEALQTLSDVSFLSTHPDTEERMAYLKSEIDSRERHIKNEVKTPEFDLEGFKKQIKEAIGNGDAGKG